MNILVVALLLQSGPELIERLKADATRQAALVELLRRTGEADAERRDPELVVCPQPDGAPPLYAVLSKFLPESTPDKAFAPADRLFAAGPRSERKTKAVLDIFRGDGRAAAPYGGNNVIDDGFLRDVDGDGLIERVDTTKYGVAHAEVLEISTLLEKPRRRFAVVLNFDLEKWAYDWSFDLRGADLHLGPKKEEGVESKVVFRWDAAKRTWTGPAGGPGDHFRVVDPADIRAALRKLEADKVSFPREPERAIRSPFAREEQATDPDVPYVRRSLKGLSDAELLAYMGNEAPRGYARAVEPPTLHDQPPQAAALAFVEANRSAKHRRRVRLAVDDSAAPPEQGSAAYADESSRCYNAIDTHWFLRCDPKGSWLAFAMSWEEGVALRGRMRDGKVYDLKVCDLSLEEARSALQFLWWLSRVRSKEEVDEDGIGMSFSTADGRGALRLPDVDAKERVWFGSLASGWQGGYTKETMVNFSQAYIEELLPRRFDGRWPVSKLDFMTATLTEAKPGQIEAACRRILRTPEGFSAPLVKVAIAAAGELGLAEALPDLRKIAGAETAIRKIESAADLEALEAQAVRGGKNDAWALEQLRRRAPERHEALVVRRIQTDPGPDNAHLFKRLRLHHPAKAKALAETLDPARTDLLALEAFEAHPVPERVDALIRIAVDRDRPWEARVRAIDFLADPRFTAAAIDEALLKVLDEPGFTLSHAVDALAHRTGGRHVQALLKAFRGAENSFVQQSMLPALARAATDARAEVLAALRRELKATQLMFDALAWCAWSAGLRELKPEIEKMATATPGAPEAREANTAGVFRDVEGRCHGARHVAALWNEEDVATRVKLLIAAAERNEARAEGAEKEAVEAVRTLDVEGRREVARFLAARSSPLKALREALR